MKSSVLISLFLVVSVSGPSMQNQLAKAGGADRVLSSVGIPGLSSQPSGSFLMVPSPLNYSFRDDFNYANVSAMVNAGWVMCGNGPASYYQVSNGVLTLYYDSNDPIYAQMCWPKIPAGVSSWSVTTRDEWLKTDYNSFVGSLTLNAYTSKHSYSWTLNFDLSSYVLYRDGLQVFSQRTSRVPGDEWHDPGLVMRNGDLSMLYDELVIGSYVEADSQAGLTTVQLVSTWGDYNSFDYVTIRQIDPNAPDFALLVGPSSQSVPEGENGNYNVSLASLNGFSGPIALTTTVSPPDPHDPVAQLAATTVVLSANGRSNSSLTVSTLTVVSSTTFDIRVNATSGSLFYSAEVSLSVQPPVPGNSFTMSISQSSLILQQNPDGSWPGNLTITLHSVGNFTGTIALTVATSGIGPLGYSVQVFPSSVFLVVHGGAISTLDVSPPRGYFVSGTWSFTVTGATAGESTAVGVGVDYIPAYFAVNGHPTSVPVAPGSPGIFNLVITSYGFAGEVTLTMSITPNVPNGPVLAYPVPILVSSNKTTVVPVTVSVNAATPHQDYQVMITVKSAFGPGWIGYANFDILPAPHAYALGVKPGVWASYSISISSLPSDTISSTLTIESVSGSNATFKLDIYVNGVFANSTIGSIDVFQGTYSMPFLPFFLIGANLTVGDPLYPGIPQSINVQSSSVASFADAMRYTISAKNYPSLNPTQISGTWDQATGILDSLDASLYLNSTYVTADYRLTATNAWSKLKVSFASSETRVATGVPVRFTSEVSGGTPHYSYAWNFGDGQTSTGEDPSHTYSSTGNYTVTLRVSDSLGDKESYVTSIAVLSSLPNIPSMADLLTSLARGFTPTSLVALLAYAAVVALVSVLAIRRDRGNQRKTKPGW